MTGRQGGPRREDHTAPSPALASVRGACPGACARRNAMTRTGGGVRHDSVLGPRSVHTPAWAGAGGWRGTMVQGGMRHADRAPRGADPRGQGPRMLSLAVPSPCYLPDGLCAVRQASDMTSSPLVTQDRVDGARMTRAPAVHGGMLPGSGACRHRRAARNGPGVGHVHEARQSQ